jgi:hypothetical protein
MTRFPEMLAVPERELAHILLCSFRYSLGRSTYIVSECRRWLEKYWDIFPEQWKEQICNDIQQSIDADRAGMKCDREDWIAVLRFAESQKAGAGMSDPFDDPKLKAYFRHAKADLFPKLKESAVSLMILGELDPKLCLELGAMVLFDKPIIVIVPRDMPITANLKRVASVIVQGDPHYPATQERLREALISVIQKDQRSRQ